MRIPRTYWLTYLFYLLAAAIITWPAVTTLSSAFMGSSTSDAYEMARHIWWFKYALQTGQPLFFQTNLGYPDGISGVTLWANPLQFFPAWVFAFVMPVSSAYNITILLTMGLNGWAMWWLARDLLKRRDHVPLLAGLIFMSFPVFQGHLFDGHAGLMVMWPAPLYLYALFKLTETPSRRFFWLAVIFFWLSPSGHMLQTIYVLLPVTALFLVGRLFLRDWAGARRVLGVALIGGVGLLLFLLPVIGETLQTESYTEAGGHIRYSADMLALISPSFQHPLFGSIVEYPRQVLGSNLAEGSSYIGIIVGILSLIGIFTKRASRWWLALGLAAWILSLGPLLKIGDSPVIAQISGYESVIPLPWALFHDLPGFNLARTPGRFNFTLALAVAMLAAYGAASLWRADSGRNLRRYALTGLVMAGILWEYQFFWPMPTLPADVPQAVIDLRERDDVRAVFSLPWTHLLAAKDALYLQTWHEKPLIAGQVSRQTPVNPAKLALLQETLDPLLLTEAGADVVMLHKNRAAESGELNLLNERAKSRLGLPFYEDEQLALFNVPEAAADVEFYAQQMPPEAIFSEANRYFYTAYAGWIDFSSIIEAQNRHAELRLNGRLIHRWQVDGVADFRLPLPVNSGGYHTLTLTLNPPCPVIVNPLLSCQGITLNPPDFEIVTRGVLYAPVTFSEGVELAAAHLPSDVDHMLDVRLWWRFSAPRHDLERRFVHLLDRNGRLAAQNDVGLGIFAADQDWVEVIMIDTSGLAAGTYRVVTGWYALPDLVRYPILTQVPGAPDGAVELGFVTIQRGE